jgi:outer membrane lipoprotein carrier protein
MLVAACLPAEAGAADGSTELSRAAAYFRDGRAHAAGFTQTYTPAGFSHARSESGTVVIQAPEKLRFDYDKPAVKVFTFDGRTARFYVPSDRQMISRPLSEADRAELPLVFLDSPERLAQLYEIAREGSVAGSAGAVVALTPRRPDSELAWIRLGLREDGAPVSLSYETRAGDRTRFDFGEFRSVPPRDPDAFTIRPPAGTRIVENEPD